MMVLRHKGNTIYASVVLKGFQDLHWKSRILALRFHSLKQDMFGLNVTIIKIMKKHFLKLAFVMGLIMSQVNVHAQTQFTEIKSGTVIELRSVKTIYAKDVEVGDDVKFTVTSDVKKGGVVLVPAGTIANGVVSEAKKSSLAGTKGRLSIDFRSLTLADGTNVPLSGNVRVCGKNRTPLAVITALFVWPCIFIPGTKAVLTEGHNATATVIANTEVPVE